MRRVERHLQDLSRRALACGRASELGARTLCWEVPHHVGDDVVAGLAARHLTRHDLRELIEACIHGLGQALALLDLATTFELEEVGNDGVLWRRYRLRGEGFSFLITEQFVPEAFTVLST